MKRDIFEKCASEQGLWVCGIDEAGRGPSAGPVVAAAAIVNLKPGGRKLLQDSKLMTADERNTAYQWLQRNSWFGIGVVSHRCIDQMGIYQANILAMHRAFAQLCAVQPLRPAIILVDAIRLELSCPAQELPSDNNKSSDAEILPASLFANPWNKTIYFTHSEKYSYSIAAASIIAKVTRDRIMQDLAQVFPQHSLEVHKGYNTQRHKELIDTHGATIIHRQSFLRADRTEQVCCY